MATAPHATYTYTDGIPAAHVGRRLAEARRHAGLSARQAAAAAGLRRGELRSFELGKASVPDATLQRLAAAYGAEPADLLPPRGPSPVAVGAGRVSVGTATRELPDDADVDDVLERYLSAVAELRGRLPGDVTGLRDADVALLSDVLGDSPEEIESRLMRLIACTRDEARLIRKALVKRRLMVPAAGLILGVGAVAPAAANGGDEPASGPKEPAAQSQPDDWAEIGESRTAVRTGDGEEDWAEIIPPLVVERDDATE